MNCSNDPMKSGLANDRNRTADRQAFAFLRRRRIKATVTAVLATAVVAAGLLFSAAVSANRSFNVAPPPAWVESVALPESGTGDSSTEATYLLIDRQVRINGGSEEHYQRRAKKLLSASALSDAAQLSIDFEPSYEQLTIHYIRIQRGAQTIDALKPKSIKIIQQEDELDQQLYNGRLSALAVLEDVRQGDIIDYAYTITGSNPVLGGRYADVFALADTYPVARLRCRLLWPGQRTVAFKGRGTDVSPAVRQLGAETEYTWNLESVKAAQFEDAAPSWYRPFPTVQLSEFATWADVVRWALPLYQFKGALPPALEAQIQQWRKLPEGEARLLAALRFVQDEIRYTGIEMGPYSHLPSPPPVVFNRRFGDCKDKSLLLATALNALGIEAHPALANTDARRTLDSYQPSPYAFNHVIVQAVLDGQTYWLDATATLQRGSMSARYNLEYERALVIRDGSAELAEIPSPAAAEPTVVVKETYTVDGNRRSAMLLVSKTYSADEADSMRYSLARTSLAELGRLHLNAYADSDPDIEQLGPPQTDDDQERNIVTVTERYRLPSFMKHKLEFEPSAIGEHMSKPRIARRAAPLNIAHPTYISQTIEVTLPEPPNIDGDSDVISDKFIRYEFHSAVVGNTLRLSYVYRSLADSVPPEEVARHLEVIEKIRGGIGYSLGSGVSGGGSGSNNNKSDALIGLVVLGLVFGPFVVFGTLKFVRSRRAGGRRNEFQEKQRQVTPPGAAPETAIPIGGEHELVGRLQSLRCACGVPVYREGAPLHRQGLSYDGRRLILVQLQCEHCRRPCDVYYAPSMA